MRHGQSRSPFAETHRGETEVGSGRSRPELTSAGVADDGLPNDLGMSRRRIQDPDHPIHPKSCHG